MSDTEKDAEVKDINVDDVLGELRDILRQKYTDTTDDDEDTSSVSFGVGDTGTSVSATSTPQKSPAHSTISAISDVSSVPEKKDNVDSEDSGVLVKSNTNTNGKSSELSTKVENDNKISNSRMLPGGLDLSISCSGDETTSPTSPQSLTLSPVMAQPIIFKTSVKKDPGSKLQDQLVKELNMVLKKRSNVDRTPSDKEESNGNVNFNKEVNRPTKKVFGNKALLAKLENHFASRTLKDRMEKQRQSIQEYEKSTENLPKSPPSEMTMFEDHLSQMLKKRMESQSETKPLLDDNISQTLKSRLEKQRQSIQEYENTVAQSPRSPPSDFAMSFSFKGSTGQISLSGESELSNESDIENRPVTERISIFQKREDMKRKRRSTSSNTSLHSTDGSESVPDSHVGVTASNNDKKKQVTIYNVRPSDGMLYSVQVQSSSEKMTGKHISYINISGCPYIQNIDEGGLPTADGEGLFRGEEDNVATFYVDVGKRRGELGVQVDGPNSIAKTTIEPDGDRYVCTYTPVEVGVFTLQLQWNGKNLPGSPFHPKIVDPRKVKIYGGWQQLMDGQERVKLIVGEEKRLVFDVSQAGPGIMKAEVQGPSSSLPVIVDSHTVGQNVICFTPEEEGNHYIHLFWAERTLPNSPFMGYAVRVSADANKVILTGRGLKEAKVREEAEFVIDGSQAGSGVPEVTLSGVRAEISNRVVPLGNGRFHCTYTPIIPGAYLLHITWNGRQLKGSPYKVNVIGAFFPHKVSVTGEGLKGGIMGKTSDVLIDVRKAGPGELTAACMGPSKVANVELHDNRDGTFHLAIKPMEVGKHVLQVKYGGEHVLGSPFILKVGSQPDASKVRVTGPGVEHGILATFQSSFVVETRGAGAGQLTVRIRGPKGGFQVEMYRDSQRDRTILCRYDPTETGLYIISIRWSGVDVPGSPFQINIVDTQQELEHLLQEQSYSSSSATPRTYAQWKAEI